MADARFAIGQLIHHVRFKYRGVVLDVDPIFMGADEWYDQVARSRPPKDQPWYHVLPDKAEHTTYVAERNLEPDTQATQIDHPLSEVYFETFVDGHYRLRSRAN